MFIIFGLIPALSNFCGRPVVFSRHMYVRTCMPILSSVDHVQHNQAVQFGDLVGSI